MMRSIAYVNWSNIDRFPADFMFQLSDQETNNLLSQNAIPSQKSLGGVLQLYRSEDAAALTQHGKHSRAVV
jgi:hypothetical protein